jgi:hypothetical protein
MCASCPAERIESTGTSFDPCELPPFFFNFLITFPQHAFRELPHFLLVPSALPNTYGEWKSTLLKPLIDDWSVYSAVSIDSGHLANYAPMFSAAALPLERGTTA